jgi:hypothetical protein
MTTGNKDIDEFTVINTMNACFAKNEQKLLEQCYLLIINLFQKNKNLSHTFWQTAIEGFLKCNQIFYVNNLLEFYPIRYSYSESTWKKVIINSLSKADSFRIVFDIFKEKYKGRHSSEEVKGYESIFNIFVEEMGNHL